MRKRTVKGLNKLVQVAVRLLQHGCAVVVSEARIEISANVAKNATSRFHVGIPGVLHELSKVVHHLRQARVGARVPGQVPQNKINM